MITKKQLIEQGTQASVLIPDAMCGCNSNNSSDSSGESGGLSPEDKETIEAAIAEKVSRDELNEVLSDKVTQEELNNSLAKKADKSEVQEALSKKADTSSINAILSDKADKAELVEATQDIVTQKELTEALAEKANTTAVEALLKEKADKSEVNSAIEAINENYQNLVSDITNANTILDAQIEKKASKDELSEALSDKIDLATLNAALSDKIDLATLSAALGDKIDLATLSAALGSKADIYNTLLVSSEQEFTSRYAQITFDVDNLCIFLCVSISNEVAMLMYIPRAINNIRAIYSEFDTQYSLTTVTAYKMRCTFKDTKYMRILSVGDSVEIRQTAMYTGSFDSISANHKLATEQDIINAVQDKVDKVEGKQLSTEDFTTALKEKLEGLTDYDSTELTEQLDTLKSRLDTLVGSEDATTVIDTFQEIEAFLEGITNKETLVGLLQEMKDEIIALTSDSAASAERLSTTVTYAAWGQNFFYNGVPHAVNGTLSYVSNINMSGNIIASGSIGNWERAYVLESSNKTYRIAGIKKTESGIYYFYGGESFNDSAVHILESNHYVGINTITPSYPLDVNGTTRTTDLIVGSTNFADVLTRLEALENNSGGASSGPVYFTESDSFEDIVVTLVNKEDDEPIPIPVSQGEAIFEKAKLAVTRGTYLANTINDNYFFYTPAQIMDMDEFKSVIILDFSNSYKYALEVTATTANIFKVISE